MNVWSVNIYVGYILEWGTNSQRVYVRVPGQAVEVREEEEEEGEEEEEEERYLIHSFYGLFTST